MTKTGMDLLTGNRRFNRERKRMAQWLCYLAPTIKVLCSNLGTTRYRMTLDKSLTAVCLGSPGRCKLITGDIHRHLWLVSVYEELK
jgi:hypothetical protein